MDEQEVILKTIEVVKSKLADDRTGHDWWHIYRVWKTSVILARQENANLFIVELASILHDIADWKLNQEDYIKADRVIKSILEPLQVSEGDINHIIRIIEEVSFKGAKVKSTVTTLEGKVVQDADRLDAIGAIGIARAFAYGGAKGREIYNPDINPNMHTTFDAYKANESPSINHFYEKLLLLKDLMNTTHGKKIAEARHEYMKKFLNEFLLEWDCNDIRM